MVTDVGNGSEFDQNRKIGLEVLRSTLISYCFILRSSYHTHKHNVISFLTPLLLFPLRS